MAVYTQVSAETLATFLTDYDVGPLRSFKGIAEGVENSNYLVETGPKRGGDAHQRFILTLYEKRVDVDDLPFFMALLDHLAARGCPVPRALPDRNGTQIRTLCGRPTCLIEFLEGVSVSEPTGAQAHAAGAALGEMHRATLDFRGERPNSMGLASWHQLAGQCSDHWPDIDPQLGALVTDELAFQDLNWPGQLPRGVIHADLFPDNVLMIDDAVGGLIDFYFSCTDVRAYDLAIAHAAWAFDETGRHFRPAVSASLIAGYRSVMPQSEAERAAMSVLARAGALRFTLTRAYDWINTPAGAMVTRKDPMAFARRLDFYRDPMHHTIFT